ncbi:MAG: tRNA (adenosine(37)-N6)-threonylcarbamoyltransferase complex dimerization subunit type 1 TsaB [Desulfobacteraceae bacterium]|jgi:tRNA threonylcarbamoyladenosine biosynthesis protein TsaB
MSSKLLAVDTATQSCGVAIIADGRMQTELILSHGGTHTKQVLAAIDAVLNLEGSSVAQIDAFAVTRGPGSFTGLRIGISTVKGLALASGKPIIGISSLDVLAHQAGGGARWVCPMIDARRNEIYWRVFRREGDGPVALTEEQVGPIDKLARQIQNPCVFIGNAVPQYAAQLHGVVEQAVQWAPEADHAIRPAVLARLAWRRFQQGDVDDTGGFAPVYLRKSDAES